MPLNCEFCQKFGVGGCNLHQKIGGYLGCDFVPIVCKYIVDNKTIMAIPSTLYGYTSSDETGRKQD